MHGLLVSIVAWLLTFEPHTLVWRFGAALGQYLHVMVVWDVPRSRMRKYVWVGPSRGAHIRQTSYYTVRKAR